MLKCLKYLSVFGLLSMVSFASEVPTGLTRSAETLKINTYEFVLSPAYTFKPNGAYLTSEIRYQANEDFGAGMAFGAGEAGFHFGITGMWYVFPDLDSQPGFSVLGGVFMNRVEQANYFAVKVAPMVSKSFKTGFGKVAPYAGLHFTPSFRLGEPENSMGVKATVGNEFMIQGLNGTKLFTEFNLGLSNSPHMISIAMAYPFVAL